MAHTYQQHGNAGLSLALVCGWRASVWGGRCLRGYTRVRASTFPLRFTAGSADTAFTADTADMADTADTADTIYNPGK